MQANKKIAALLKRLKKAYPGAGCKLNHSNSLHLLIATILSAQCTDERVNQVTPVFFKTYPDAKAIAGAPLLSIEAIIRSTGFFRNKAKNIKSACTLITEQFNGKVPDTMEELLLLPGVARKTANVVLGTAFGKASGVVVDTHVSRLSQRLGLTKHKNPEKIEIDLINVIPKKSWILFSHQLIHHGRAICKARSPLCAKCPLEEICPASTLKTR